MRRIISLALVALASWSVPLSAQTDKPKDSGKKEAAKPKPKPKPEDDNRITMTVVTKTGSKNKFARADKIKIYVLINGDPNQKAQLVNPRKNNFESGATDTFKNIPVNVPLDKIETMRLAVDGDDMWKCESIHFQFFQKDLRSREYKFNPARFLSSGKEKKNLNATAHLDFKLTTKPVLAPPEPDDKDKPEEKKDKPDEKKKK